MKEATKKRYRITGGVSHVAGNAVGKAKTIELNDSEALYEKAIGRITPHSGKLTDGGKGNPSVNEDDEPESE